MLKQPAKAAPLLRAAAEAEPANADLRFRLAAVLLETGDLPGAAREFLAVVERQRDNREAWNGLAFALYRLEDHNGALKALDRARQLGPEPPGNHFLRAIILDKFQQYPAALESYRKFLAEAGGRYPDDEFKARQRVRILTNLLNKRR
jgi:tetratricopeptide (TPR) repeat protein